MDLTDAQKRALGVALNEATLLGMELDTRRRRVGATFAVLTLPPSGGPGPDDPRVQFLFDPVGRVVSSLREGRSNHASARVVEMQPDDLLGVVQSFGGMAIYGKEFFDITKPDMTTWGNRLSLDWRSGPDGTAYSVRVFQDAAERHLEIRVWFDAFVIRDATGRELSIAEFTEGGKRWWDAFYANDPRTGGHGLFPLAKQPRPKPWWKFW